MPYIELTNTIRAPIEICFDLSRDIDVHSGSMAHSGERAVAGVTRGLIGPDEEVTWEARHLGLTWHVTSRITEFDRPHFFVDEMQRGPFPRFRHEHHFSETPADTLMIDRVDYRSPFGPLGRFADLLFAERYLRRLLEIRNRYIKEMAEVGTAR